MKTISYAEKYESVPYPNAATRRQMYTKILNYLLTAAAGMGMAAVFLLILALA